jgi:fructokinase
MSTRRGIVCAGYMPLDIIRTPTKTIGRHAGGTAANVAAILAFHGWHSLLAGIVGDDFAGEELVADLRDAGVDTTQLRRIPGASTCRLIHEIRPDAHVFRYRCPECGNTLPRSRPLTLEHAEACAEAYPSPDVFFFDRANAATVNLAERYAAAGSVVVFEPSVPANAELLARAAAVAQVVKHSDDRSVGGLADLHVRVRAGQVRVVTHGAEGLEILVGNKRARHLSALATLTVDTGGAGDWTTAGLLHRAVHRRQLIPDLVEDALRYGQALAAVNCATLGARGLMRLKPSTAARRAAAVLSEGGLRSRPCIPQPRCLPKLPDKCPVCLLSVPEQLAFPNDIADMGV